jgi:hypothetical protein
MMNHKMDEPVSIVIETIKSGKNKSSFLAFKFV